MGKQDVIAEAIGRVMPEIAVELGDEFDQNFERKYFLGKAWPKSKHGLIESGELRRSLVSQVEDEEVVVYSDKEYASIHNEGGRIKVTQKMRGYFWHKYKETGDEIWAALGKKAVGSYIEIPQRQYVGDHRRVQEVVEKKVIEAVETAMETEIERILNRK